MIHDALEKFAFNFKCKAVGAGDTSATEEGRRDFPEDCEYGQKQISSTCCPVNDFQRVCLRLTGQPGSDYINGSWINGYRQSNAFMVTQAPLDNTVNDLWRMVWESGSKTIVMLNDLQDDMAQYWPEPQKKQVYGSLTVSSKTEDGVDDTVCTRAFEIYRNGSVASPLQEVRTVTQFHLRGWPRDGLPSQSSLLLDLVDRVLKKQRSTGNKPVTVMCS
ncbi:Receptor-type tyrosine-protein phosphatase epsilon [Geodia barretti]|uniref:Receptor-type tyrosine-protein phosphatase epsilon n=1 Tax=Geodia barretti TaxID=519541 RepID=A0AA35S0T5_GEOBA|nr:Receptor-type tyrosine-protein phosphatase epsilon [Geodia barretti]